MFEAHYLKHSPFIAGNCRVVVPIFDLLNLYLFEQVLSNLILNPPIQSINNHLHFLPFFHSSPVVLTHISSYFILACLLVHIGSKSHSVVIIRQSRVDVALQKFASETAVSVPFAEKLESNFVFSANFQLSA